MIRFAKDGFLRNGWLDEFPLGMDERQWSEIRGHPGEIYFAVTDVNLTWQAVTDMPQLNRRNRGVSPRYDSKLPAGQAG